MTIDETHDSEALLSKESVDSEESWDYSAKLHRPKSRRKEVLKKVVLSILIIFPWTVIIVLGISGWNLGRERKPEWYIRPELTYSPVEDVIEYELKTFTTGFPEDNDYSPYADEPSPEVDQVWKDLYPSVIQLIPQEKAAKLPNRTVIYPHDEQRRYAIELDVFHQLHCLNMVRKATRPDYYIPELKDGEDVDPDVQTGHKHIAHCIDAIRQSIMCASDVTAYTWQWSEEFHGYVNHVKNPHICRNFDVLREWARVNTKRIYFDNVRVMNDPLDPDTWIDGYMGE